MGYNYATERPKLFTEDGQIMFLKVRDNAKRLIQIAGAARAEEILLNVSGDSWMMQACIDRLVELGELFEVQNPTSSWGQHRIFTTVPSVLT